MNFTPEKLKNIIESAILAIGQPISLDQLIKLFAEEEKPAREDIRNSIKLLQEEYSDRGMELVEVSSGFRIQAKQDNAQWVSRLWEEKPARYSRALLETLVLIAYKQPITRGEIENVRGVSVSSNIIKTLQEREWVRVVGHRDVPGRPAIYATTRQFLDYFNLKSLDQLPTLSEIRDLDKISEELAAQEGTSDTANVAQEKNEESIVSDDSGELTVGDNRDSDQAELASSDAESSVEAVHDKQFEQQHIAQELKDLSENIKGVDHEAETFIEESEHTIEEIESETDLNHIKVENIATFEESQDFPDQDNTAKNDSLGDENLVVEIIHNTVNSEESDQDITDYIDSSDTDDISVLES